MIEFAKYLFRSVFGVKDEKYIPKGKYCYTPDHEKNKESGGFPIFG